jgi:hypothetical protein
MMKGKALALLAVLVLVAGTAFAGPIPALTGNEFTISNEELATMDVLTEPVPPDINIGTVGYNVPGENDVIFEYFRDVDGQNTGFEQVQFGWAMEQGPGTLPGEYWDLSDWDSYMLSFHNLADEPVMVNLFMNTGWTDNPRPDEVDKYYQNTWTWAEPCQHIVLDLDFSDAESWIGGVYNPHDSIPDLDRVTAIGFNFGGNDPDLGGYGAPGLVSVSVDTHVVPEPATMMLLGTGLVGAALARKRRRK